MNAFREWDSDRNGYISQSELRRVLVHIGLPGSEVGNVFKAMDANKDGNVDYDEFVSWLYGGTVSQEVQDYVNRTDCPEEALDDFFDFMKAVKAETTTNKKGETIEKYKKLRDLFDAIDLNGSGKISMSEFKAGVKSLGHVCDDGMLEEIFELIDTERVATRLRPKPFDLETQQEMIDAATEAGKDPPIFDEDGYLEGDISQYTGGKVTMYSGNDPSKHGKIAYDPRTDKKKDYQISFKEFKKAFNATG